jgi:hypothetical protein
MRKYSLFPEQSTGNRVVNIEPFNDKRRLVLDFNTVHLTQIILMEKDIAFRCLFIEALAQLSSCVGTQKLQRCSLQPVKGSFAKPLCHAELVSASGPNISLEAIVEYSICRP